MSDGGEELIPLHTRNYDVLAFRKDASTLLLRGEVRDVKPPGLYIEDDPEPLTVHHMVIELSITVPDLVIVEASARMEAHPQPTCPNVMPAYGQIVGLSIARGFNAKVRELFGGPLGCTHTTALLLAMAPVALQSAWSLNMLSRAGEERPRRLDPAAREGVIRSSLNTCHIWAEDGPHHLEIRDSGDIPPAMPMRVRLRQLGREPFDTP
jgi:hypothetical protein